jgi:NADH-ubiquinone oxidoreductase chain 3
MTQVLVRILASRLVGGLIRVGMVVIRMKSEVARRKLSRFECGFERLEGSRTPFSLQFFLVSLVFLIFDVELVLLFPIISEVLWRGLIGGITS